MKSQKGIWKVCKIKSDDYFIECIDKSQISHFQSDLQLNGLSVKNYQNLLDLAEAILLFEKEKLKQDAELLNKELPTEFLNMLKEGILRQWEKHPNIFFVKDVEKARIIYNIKNKTIESKHFQYLKNIDEKKKFATVFKILQKSIKDANINNDIVDNFSNRSYAYNKILKEANQIVENFKKSK